jgi:hypothetical protein
MFAGVERWVMGGVIYLGGQLGMLSASGEVAARLRDCLDPER